MKSKGETSNKASISYSNQNITNLSSIANNVPVEKLDLSGNPIVDFSGLKVFPELYILDCSNTQLSSFNNFPNQKGIKSFFCKKTLLCSYPLLYLMSSIVFGPSLESVNGLNIKQTKKANAVQMSQKVRPYLTKGWILQNLDPVKIIHTKTRQRKTFYLTLDENETAKSDSDSENNSENDQDVYLEDYSESDTAETNTAVQNNNNPDFKETEIDEDERLRQRFMRLQESVLLELKRPDVVQTIIKSGRVTVLSNYPSRSASSLSSRQLNSLRPRAQTSLKNYPAIIKDNQPK